MKNRRLILLKTLLLSSSGINTLRHSSDKSRRGRIIGGYIGITCLYLFLLMPFCISSAIGLGNFGLQDAMPPLGAALICILTFLFTMFKANGYLFAFKGYDLLMAMPFSAKDMVACKFLQMYIDTLPYVVCISLSYLIAYCITAPFNAWTIISWIVLTAFIPIIPMLLASAIGALIAKIGSGMGKSKKPIQVILTFFVTIPLLFSRFIIEKIFRTNTISDIVDYISTITNKTAKIIITAGWFQKAVIDANIVCFLLIIGISVLLFELLFSLVSKSYRKINSLLMTQTSHKKHHTAGYKQRSMVKSIALKETKRFFGSTTYVINLGMGYVIAIIIGIAAFFIDPATMLQSISNGASSTGSLNPKLLEATFPFISYLCVGMIASTCCSPSLEGKNYWIIKTLPINRLTDYHGKLLFNMYITVPCALFCTISLDISVSASLVNILLSAVLSFVLCLFSSCFGLAIGIKHRKLDWENEIEVIKQGSAVALYLFPNMLVTILVIIMMLVVGNIFDTRVVYLVTIAIVSLLSLLSYSRIKAFARKEI